MTRMKLLQWLSFYTLTIFAYVGATAQSNKVATEVLPYKDIDGYMIVRANVGGTEGDFLLDSRGKVAVTEQAAVVRGMKSDGSKNDYPRKGFEVVGGAKAIGFFVGNTVYAKEINTRIIKSNALLNKLKVDGVLGFAAFANAVITINSKAKTITLSTPYKPSYMKLVNRDEAELSQQNGLRIQTTVNDKPVKAIVDFYEPQPFAVSAADAKLVSSSTATVKMAGILASNIKVVKSNDPESYAIVGKPILDKGVISFDIARGKYYFQPFNQNEDTSPALVGIKNDAIAFIPGKVNAIDRAYFLEHVYDYRKSKVWQTKGDKPVVVDFWATWCGPCMKMMPVMEELAAKYKDKVNFYKVNVDKEGELRQVFEADAIPLIIFGPVNGEAAREVGADTREKIEAQIRRLLQ